MREKRFSGTGHVGRWTEFNGAVVVAGARCAHFDVDVDGRPTPIRRVVSFGAGGHEVSGSSFQPGCELRHDFLLLGRRDLREERQREESEGVLRGVLHCFTGTPALARDGLALGLHVSFAGIITFRRSDDLRQTVALIPPARLLVETDSPFLAPVPHRGVRNEPAFVARVLATLAELHDMEPAAMDAQTTANFHSLFRP